MSKYLFVLSAVLIAPCVAQAQGSDSATDLAFDFVNRFNDVILFPTIGLLSALALLVFIFGAFQYIVYAADPAARQQGVKHITWGIVGLVVMLSAYTILLLFANTFGLGDELDCANNPGASGCEGGPIPFERYRDGYDTGDSDGYDTGDSDGFET